MPSQQYINRYKKLNPAEISDGEYLVYWMQASQRVEQNHALEFAIEWANDLKAPLVVFFGITDDYPDANERHYAFMLQGLKEVSRQLEKRGIQIIVRHESPEKGIVEFVNDSQGVVTDRGYTKIQRSWRTEISETLDVPFYQVETDVVVPIEIVSEKREYAARTIRPKIHKQLDTYMAPVEQRPLDNPSLSLKFEGLDISDPEAILGQLNIDRSVSPVDNYIGGYSEAIKHLDDFIKNKLSDYDEKRGDPTTNYLSNMSPYLQFGQISPIEIALKVQEADAPDSAKEAYLEELIVRRELSMNFCYYDENYDNLDCIPGWARKTLEAHREDPRQYVYSFEVFENAETHDPYWNAAQREMMKTGKMHGYMRMYWGKKILEWSEDPAEAFQIALRLNNKYELDGRNPNGYAGVAWCFGNHDRAWPEREVFGKVRYMNANGLKRKFDADAYIDKVAKL